MSAEHHDWSPAYDEAAGAWRVARTDSEGRQVYGASPTGDGAPYHWATEDRAAAFAKAMNSVGHS